MDGDGRVRFCSLCKLNVYNISEMTQKEAETLLENRSSRTCLRLYRRPDGTLLTKDCPVGRRIIDGIKRQAYAIAATIAATFVAMLNATTVFGQQELKEFGQQKSSKIENPFVLGVSEGSPPTTPSLMNSSASRPAHIEVASKADTSALDFFQTAQDYEVANEPARALESYENAIHVFRSSRLSYDNQFVEKVAKHYARLLQKQHQTRQAKLIQKEFCNRK
jgi:hypothetical protein